MPAVAVGCTVSPQCSCPVCCARAHADESLRQVVHKPAEMTPLTSFALAELGHRAGLPDGVYNCISGDAPAIGALLA